jgi:hypothetical protein
MLFPSIACTTGVSICGKRQSCSTLHDRLGSFFVFSFRTFNTFANSTGIHALDNHLVANSGSALTASSDFTKLKSM